MAYRLELSGAYTDLGASSFREASPFPSAAPVRVSVIRPSLYLGRSRAGPVVAEGS